MAKLFSKNSSSPFCVSQQHKHLRAHRAPNCQASSFRFSPSITDHSHTTKDDTMPIPVSDRFRNWLQNKGLQGYLKFVDIEPHPSVAEIVNQIDAAKITNRQVCQFLNLKREGFDGMEPLKPEVLRSYFGEYLPSDKAGR